MAKIRDIEDKIRALQAMKKALTKLVAQCTGHGPITACPILESLDADDGDLSVGRVKGTMEAQDVE